MRTIRNKSKSSRKIRNKSSRKKTNKMGGKMGNKLQIKVIPSVIENNKLITKMTIAQYFSSPNFMENLNEYIKSSMNNIEETLITMKNETPNLNNDNNPNKKFQKVIPKNNSYIKEIIIV
jgi:hypothetical protein